ncbi:hypothetical protein HXP44_09400 [Streptomyces sioyaensis]|uniref:Uncharacterized protein n=1 Tax=Streptomyces sioyaensis TaxID=67364 RepID=A0A4Q1R597_9ACTN|nr:hypothetical protein [Streptomyces sioyaensis]MBM4792263.1 hypothetical protein [Streptomyces sioyaensis]RXS67593.1 hypothetical protein EST54_11340 [Streptomyces sioyaensis]
MNSEVPGGRSLLGRLRGALTLCVLLGGLSLALVSNDRHGFWWSALNELALFAAAGVAIPFYYDLFLRDVERGRFLGEMTRLLDERLLSGDAGRGLTVRAEGRPSPTEKAVFLAGAQKEIIEIGVALRSLASLFVSRPERDFAAPVRQLLSAGVNITYVVADPESALLAEYARSIRDPDLPARAADSARELLAVTRRFDAEGLAGRMSVRITHQLPTCYLSLVDADTESGHCRTAPYLPGVRRADSPVIDIARAGQPELFARYVTYARSVLEDSRLLDAP